MSYASICHPNRKHYAKGLCRECWYTAWSNTRKAECHPDRPHVAHGLCQKCYLKGYKKEWYAKNKETILQKSREWYRTNKQRVLQRTGEYQRIKTATDVNYKLARRLRNRVWAAVRHGYKNGSGVRDLGCTLDFFKEYIESLWSNGMSWENYGKWHLDHIEPLASFDLTNKTQFLKAAHYMNYQPLWAKDNLSKRRPRHVDN